MKAIILAAGKGERLGKISEETPKPMLIFDGKPILQHNIELCKKYYIEEIYINLHHFPIIISDYFGDGERFGVKIKYIFERELLGTSGAVKNISNRDSYFKENPFFVLYGDNYSNYNLDLLISNLTTIAFHKKDNISESGVAEFDENNRILSFIEKPKYKVNTNWVNAGIYYLQPEILNYIPDGFSDFSKDIFPKLLENNIAFFGIKDENSNVRSFDTINMLEENKINY